MTWANVIATGNGDVAWRLAIDGFLYEAVTHKSMETTAADGRIRYNGLKSDGIKWSERLEGPSGTVQATGMTIEIVDTRKRWTAAFGREPQIVTWLTANEDNTGNTISCASTADFPSSGTIYLDSEAITYTSKAAAEFQGCSRGQYASLAQYHYVTFGSSTRNPEITDWPRSIEGRRARLYAYGPGDSKTGNGTAVWTGVIRTEPRFNGTTWSFTVDPLHSILNVDIGADLEDPRTPRGIYYPYSAPLYMRIDERSGATLVSSEATYARIGFAGFYETQEAFCAALQTHIQNVLTSHAEGPVAFTQTNMRVVPDGASWRMEFTTDAASPRWMGVTMVSPTDGEVIPGLLNEDDDGVGTVATSTTYRIKFRATADVPNPGTVPRLAIGHHPSSYGATLPPNNMSGVDSSTAPMGRIYVDAEPLAAVTRVQIEWPIVGAEEPATFTRAVTAVSAGSRYLDLDTTGLRPAYYVATADALPTFRLTRDIATGTIADLISGLAGATAQYVNTGGVPFIRPTAGGTNGDFDLANSELDHLTSDPITANRTYTLLASTSLKELLEHECRLAGVYPCYNSSGQLVFRRMRLAALSELSDSSMTKSTIMVGNQFLGFEKNVFGQFNTVLIRTGYDPAEDDHKGTTYKVRDVAAYGANPQVNALEIAPKSESTSPLSAEDAVRIADRILGTWGAPYRTVTLGASKTLFARLLGDVVSVSWRNIPDSDGTLGVTDKIGILIGREWEIMASRGTFTILLSDQRIGGYVPSAKITSISGTSGTAGEFTLTLSSDYFPSGTNATNWWTAGDKVRVFRWNSTTAGTVLADVVSASGYTLTIDTGATTWTHTGSTWCVDGQVSTSITAAGQKTFAHIAGSDRIVDWSGATDPAFTLA